MKRFGRYDRSVIFWIITVVSISGMALISSPKTAKKYLVNMDVSVAIEDVIEYTLNTGFENSLNKIELKNSRIPLEMEIEKGYEINNKIVDLGLVYRVKVDDTFSQDEALRKMVNILSDDYMRIRREGINQKNNDHLTSVEEKGIVFREDKSFNYINKVIRQGDDVWLFILTFEEDQSGKVQDFLDSIWIGNEKGVQLS